MSGRYNAGLRSAVRRVKRIVHTWKQAQVVVERWRKNLTNVQVELRQPRVIDVSPIDFVSGEPIDRKGTPTKRQLMTQSKMGGVCFQLVLQLCERQIALRAERLPLQSCRFLLPL